MLTLQTEMTEGELIQSIRSGDTAAFGELMDRFYPMVFRACYRMTGNTPDAEELAHDSFVEAYLKLDQLRDPERFAGWLKSLTLNLCRMWYRRRKRDFIGLPEDLPAEEPADDDDGAIGERMSYGLSVLSPEHRLVLVLHYFEELTYDETARFLEIPVGTVMSRLHRARQSLRKVLEGMTEDEEIPQILDGRFKEEVQAEIAVLLDAFRDNPSAAERLTVMLTRSPEFVGRLIRDAASAETLRNLAILLPRMGPDAIDQALDAFAFGEGTAASNAAALLSEYAARMRPVCAGNPCSEMASLDAYLLLDRLFVSPMRSESKVAAIAHLLDSCRDEATIALLSNSLLRYPEAAADALLERFASSADAEDAWRPDWVIHALCRFGARFYDELAAMLEFDDERLMLLGITGLEAVARAMDQPLLADATDLKVENEVRSRAKWPPIRSEQVGEERLTRLTADAVALVSHTNPELRNSAIRTLGHLHDRAPLDLIRASAAHPDPSTRLAAILALSEIGDPRAGEIVLKLASDESPQVRLAAIKALGRLDVERAQPFLAELIEDGDAKVREAAVMSLGSIGGFDAEAVLRGIIENGDRRLRKTAALALYGGAVHERPTVKSEVDLRLAEKRRRRSTPVVTASLDAAIRYAIPEARLYDDREITERIAAVCEDYCATRRYLIEQGLMTRADGVYELTSLGERVWRVEHALLAGE